MSRQASLKRGLERAAEREAGRQERVITMKPMAIPLSLKDQPLEAFVTHVHAALDSVERAFYAAFRSQGADWPNLPDVPWGRRYSLVRHLEELAELGYVLTAEGPDGTVWAAEGVKADEIGEPGSLRATGHCQVSALANLVSLARVEEGVKGSSLIVAP